MRVDLSNNMVDVLGWTARFDPQFRFAAAKGLTDTMRQVSDLMPAAAQSAFQGGAVEFTRRAFVVAPARKDNLSASVAVKPVQAEYLQYQVEGGRRSPKRQALRLPSVVNLTAEGNLPAGLIKALVARARVGRRATASQARRFGVSRAVDLFYGEPGDGRPAGIYKRVANGSRNQLVPMVVFPKQAARYAERRLDFYGIADRGTQRLFDRALDAAWKLAQATAR